MKKIIIAIILFCMPVLGLAQDCVLIPNKSLCGVAITATGEQFIKTLGEPDGTINMGPDRIGYFYGQRLLLIFWHKKLWEVHAWETDPSMNFWSYVRNRETRNTMRLKFDKWSPWGLTRKQIGIHDAEFPVRDADQFFQDRKAGNADMLIFYSPFDSVNGYPSGGLNDWKSYKIQSIKITFYTNGGKP